MDKPTPKDRLEHIRVAILRIRSFVEGKSVTDFLAEKVLQDAVLYQFIIIGEAISHVDKAILDKYPYPWHIPRSFRNYIAREYHKIRIESVFNAINDLNGLLEVVEVILSKEY